MALCILLAHGLVEMIYYNFTIIVYDSSSNSAVDTVYITVEDTTSPTISSPSDFSYEVGNTGNNITWVGTDTNPDTYLVYRNGTQVDSGSWSDGVDIVIDIDGLSVAVYNFTIWLNDTSNNSVTDLVWITVTEVDTTAPILNEPANITYVEGTFGHNIIWVATDDYPNNYTVFYNSMSYENGTWESGVNIVINIDGLTYNDDGSDPYNFTIVVRDLNNNQAYDSVYVIVTKSTSGVNGPFLPSPITTINTIAFPKEVAIILFAFVAIVVVMILLSMKEKRKTKSVKIKRRKRT